MWGFCVFSAGQKKVGSWRLLGVCPAVIDYQLGSTGIKEANGKEQFKTVNLNVFTDK